MSRSSAGLWLSKVLPLVESVHSPAMKWRNVGTSVGVALGGVVAVSVMDASVGQPRRRTYACRSCWSALRVPPERGGAGSSARISAGRRREVALLPAGLGGDGVRIVGRGQPGGDRRVRHAAGVGCHVGNGGGVSCGAGGGRCGRFADLPRRGVCRHGQRARRPDPQLASGEGSGAVDGVPRTRVAWGPRLEQRQRPFGTVRGPDGQHAPVVLAQGQRARLASRLRRGRRARLGGTAHARRAGGRTARHRRAPCHRATGTHRAGSPSPPGSAATALAYRS